MTDRLPIRNPKSAIRNPRTRPPLERLKQLRALLRAGGGSAAALAEGLEVSERTIRRDLEFARDRLDWPVEYCARRRAWNLTGDPAELPAIAMTEGELVALLVAAEAMETYRGTPYAPALASAFEKIVAALDSPVTLAVDPESLPRFTGPPPRLAPLGGRPTTAQYEQLAQACRDRRRVEIIYHSLERDEVNTRRIDPYCLLLFGGDPYLIAYDHLRRAFRTFALGERMREVVLLDETFTPDPAFELERYLAEGFGLFRGGTVEEVVLRFSPAVARYLRERVWDESERKEDLPDGSLRLSMRVPVNVGLLRFVLQYGAAVEVEAPPALRAQVRAEARRMAAIYGEPDA